MLEVYDRQRSYQQIPAIASSKIFSSKLPNLEISIYEIFWVILQKKW